MKYCLIAIVSILCGCSNSLDIFIHKNGPNEVTSRLTEPPCDVCPLGGKCVPHIQCPAHLRENSHNPECHIGTRGSIGICCRTGQSHASEMDRKQRKVSSVDKRVMENAHKTSHAKLTKLIEKEKLLVSKHGNNVTIKRNTPSYGHFQSTRSANMEAISKISEGAVRNVLLAQELKQRQAFDADDLQYGLYEIKAPFCPPPPSCSPGSAYASLSGVCNNVANPAWGAENTAYVRLLPPNYSDGVWSVRENANSRLVTSALLPDAPNPHPQNNLMLTQFGQFLAHDTTNAVILSIGNHSAISCCTPDGQQLPPELTHFACDPILIPPEDPFYSQFSQTCMNFVRTQVTPPDDCTLSYARQMNGVTHFLDLSHLYGNDEKCRTLREGSGGRLKMKNDYGRELLPTTSDDEDCSTGQDRACFDSGDGHANQMISLVGLHTIFAREHNRVCAHLAKTHPEYDDDKLFYEARRIVIAEYQHIVYSEWLPLVVGHQIMDMFSLHPIPPLLYAHDYQPDVNPSISNEFAVVGLRFGHSTVDGQLHVLKEGKLYESVSLPEVMFAPSRMRLRPFLDRMLNGLVHQPMQTVDPFITEALSQYMFHTGNPFGLDLASINIKRGRDHGVRSYNDYRRLIGAAPLSDFSQFSAHAASRLASVYGNPEAVEAWPGALLEKPIRGATVGPVFANILAEQFWRLRVGDRYHYQNAPGIHPHPFSLCEVRKVTLARLLCDNSDGVELKHLPSNAFVRPDILGNEPLPCDSILIPRVNLDFF